MQPAAACFAALLCLSAHVPVRARSSVKATPFRGNLRLREVPVLVQRASTDVDSQVSLRAQPKEAPADVASEKKNATGSKEEKKPDTDTLTHELVDQATKTPVHKEFDILDRDGNQKIDYMEYRASTRAGKRVATKRFNCTDNNVDGVVSLDEFAKAQENPKDVERCMSMLLAFQMIDRNRDGEVSQNELWKTTGRSAVDFDGRWAFFIACSDLNGDGKISPMEFTSDMYGCIEKKSDEAYIDFSKFNTTDADGNGCADEDEMSVAVNKLFGLQLLSDKPPSRATKKLTNKWMHCVDADSSRCLSEKEYGGLLTPTPEQGQCIGKNYGQYEHDMDFEIMDGNDDGKVSRQEYYTWCSKLDIEIHQEEVEALFKSADSNKDGFISQAEFETAGEHHEGDGRGVFLFAHSTDASQAFKSLTAWRGSVKSTWKGFFQPPTN